jgi:predicted O-methyltransferase YrrM
MPSTTLSRNRRILTATARGFARGLIKRPTEFRRHVVRDAWTTAKTFAAEPITNIEFREIPCLQDAKVDAFIDDRQRAIIAALVRGLEARTFFEIGTNRGRTTWTVAHHNEDLTLYTLDIPPDDDTTKYALADDDRVYIRPPTQCGEAFAQTADAQRITQLYGDSATFDYTPYKNQIDFVYIDGAHTYEYVKSDTAHALTMLSPTGTIAWDDYATGPGVYEALIELAPTFDGPVYHVLETRMAIYSRTPFVTKISDNFPFGA